MVVSLREPEGDKGDASNEGDAKVSFRGFESEMGRGELSEISSVYDQPWGERSWMIFKDWGVAWLEVHAEMMRLDESFEKYEEKQEQRVKEWNSGTTHCSKRGQWKRQRNNQRQQEGEEGDSVQAGGEDI